MMLEILFKLIMVQPWANKIYYQCYKNFILDGFWEKWYGLKSAVYCQVDQGRNMRDIIQTNGGFITWF